MLRRRFCPFWSQIQIDLWLCIDNSEYNVTVYKYAGDDQINKRGRQIEIMTSRASVAKKIKIKDLPKIDLNVYSMIALNNLVVYAVHYLQEHGVTATVEEIVSVCFRLFPQSFALKNYPRWPDSALVIRRLNEAGRMEISKATQWTVFP